MHKKCGYFSIIPLLKLYKTISSKAQVSFPFIYLRYILFLILSKVYRHVFITKFLYDCRTANYHLKISLIVLSVSICTSTSSLSGYIIVHRMDVHKGNLTFIFPKTLNHCGETAMMLHKNKCFIVGKIIMGLSWWLRR